MNKKKTNVFSILGTDPYGFHGSYTRIKTTPDQDARAIRLAKLAKETDLPYCVAFNNCAHMARMIIDGAGIPVGNRLIDSPEKLQKDILDYLNRTPIKANKDCQ